MTVKYKAGVIIKHVRILQAQYPKGIYMAGTKSVSQCCYSYGAVTCGPKTRGCAIGQAIRAAYPDLYEKIKSEYNEALIGEVLDACDIAYTDNQKEWLTCFQNNQDYKQPWGVCHKQLDRYYN